MTEISAQTVGELLQIGEDNDVALAAPGRPPLNYAGLRRQASATAAALSALGIEHSDRVAIVLPDGPEMASAFLCVAAAATTAPLNPAYSEPEFEFYLSDGCESRMAVMSAAWFVEFRQRLPWLLHVD